MASRVLGPRSRGAYAVAPFLLASILLAPASGCVERQSGAEEELSPRELISTEATSPQHPLAIRFEDKVELVGYDLEPSVASPGERITITWHWKVLRAVDSGFRLFTHLDDGQGGLLMNLDGAGPIRRGYAPDRWRAGEYIRDPQSFVVPPGVTTSRLDLYLGFFRGPHRMGIVSGPNDGHGRARGASVGVANASAATSEVPSLAVKRADAIALDGKLDEAAWASAARTERFVETMRGGTAPFEARARFLYDDRFLYVAYEVEDTRLLASLEGRDAHLWEQDCVELFVDPSGSGRGYMEMQVSPRGVTFDTRYDSRRVPRPFGRLDFESGIEARVITRGTVDDDEDDEGYVVEARIPFASLGMTQPAPGASVRVNMYVMNKLERGMTAAAWSPPLVGDFHVPARFGRLEFR